MAARSSPPLPVLRLLLLLCCCRYWDCCCLLLLLRLSAVHLGGCFRRIILASPVLKGTLVEPTFLAAPIRPSRF